MKVLGVLLVILGVLAATGIVLAVAGFLVFLIRAYLPSWFSVGILPWAAVISLVAMGRWAWKEKDFFLLCACTFGAVGGIMNGIVILANNFRMPVIDSAENILASGLLSKIYVSAADNSVRLFFFGDQIPFLGVAVLSPGDIFLGLALLFNITATVINTLKVFRITSSLPNFGTAS